MGHKNLVRFLLACKHSKSIAKTHALIIITGLATLKNSGQKLLSTYSRIGDLIYARKVFDKMPQRGVEAWNALINGYSRKNSSHQVLNLYHQMLAEGVRPDSSSFTISIKACIRLMDFRMGEEIWSQAVSFGYECDVFVVSSVLNLYAKCGKMDEAMVVFDKMSRRDLVSWTTMLTGFVHSGRPREAIDVYRRVQEEERMEGDTVLMLGLIQASAILGDSKLGRSVHGYMVRKHYQIDVVAETSLVDMYAKNGYLEFAVNVFDRMPNKNNVSWGALISGFAQNGFARNALELFVEMQSFGFRPDLVSLVSALLACSQVGLLRPGRSIHGYMVRRNNLEQVSGTALIDLNSKCGALSHARALFDRIGSKDRIAWNAMISSYGIHGHGKEALSIFFQMTTTKLKPDHATFAALLSALGHSGLVNEGRYWFDVMIKEYDIEPTAKHYACMVDLLARAGQVEEAYELVCSIESDVEIGIWVALLSGCHNHGKWVIGEMVAEKILELKPDDMGVHALVSNFFAVGRKWDKVASVRKMMKESGMKKVAGYSVVDVEGKLHAFLMGDKSHHQHEAILYLLDGLDHEMRLHERL